MKEIVPSQLTADCRISEARVEDIVVTVIDTGCGALYLFHDQTDIWIVVRAPNWETAFMSLPANQRFSLDSPTLEALTNRMATDESVTLWVNS